MTPKLYKAADVCEIAQLQPYVLRSWEKEFPGIGVQKSAEAPRLYRQSDLDQVLRIKQLVFSEGLTLAGARRRLEEEGPAAADGEMAEVIEVLGADAHNRIAHVRDGLRSLLLMLDGRGDDYALTAPSPEKTARSPRGARESMASSQKVVAVRAKSTTKRVSRAR